MTAYQNQSLPPRHEVDQEFTDSIAKNSILQKIPKTITRHPRDVISTFRRVLINGFYPEKYHNLSSRKAHFKRKLNKGVRNRRKFHQFRDHRRIAFKKFQRLPKTTERIQKFNRLSKSRRKVNNQHQYLIARDAFRLPFVASVRKGNYERDDLINSLPAVQRFPRIQYSSRRFGYGRHSGHSGTNSILVTSGGGEYLWPLLGLFSLFQLATTGAIGN